jgi:NAD(P)-dependent dehydrogenase (short-subunit alcohol dehydrogenase family)
MELAGRAVVVTGAGRGIGAALARRFAQAGARVVVNDLDADAAADVATDIGGHAVPGDATSADGAARLVAQATDHLGSIDLFCANAGVAVAGGPDASEDAWARSWEINVMGHVRAARALLPGWLERGRGHFLATVSAAGLLSQIGSAPYAVTKHGALAFAEWMAITYGDRGITVQALCPQGVRTDLLARADERIRALLEPSAVSAEHVADVVIEALADGRFLVLPHSDVGEYTVQRAKDPDRWLAGMRRLQARLD